MIYSFVIVCLGLNCPWGIHGDDVYYESRPACEDAATERLGLMGYQYPMRLIEKPLRMPEPDHIFRYMCAQG